MSDTHANAFLMEAEEKRQQARQLQGEADRLVSQAIAAGAETPVATAPEQDTATETVAKPSQTQVSDTNNSKK
jgi:hypothetical protein